jgi:hypothetical protein
MAKSTMTSKCTSNVGHFDGHGSAPGQYRRHRLMRHVQGYSGSHWMLASSNYLLRIAQAAARATGKHTTINKFTLKGGQIDGHGNALVQYHAHCPMEEV